MTRRQGSPGAVIGKNPVPLPERLPVFEDVLEVGAAYLRECQVQKFPALARRTEGYGPVLRREDHHREPAYDGGKPFGRRAVDQDLFLLRHPRAGNPDLVLHSRIGEKRSLKVEPLSSDPDDFRIPRGIETLGEAEIRDGFEDVRLSLSVRPQECINAVARLNGGGSVITEVAQPDSGKDHIPQRARQCSDPAKGGTVASQYVATPAMCSAAPASPASKYCRPPPPPARRCRRASGC